MLALPQVKRFSPSLAGLTVKARVERGVGGTGFGPGDETL